MFGSMDDTFEDLRCHFAFRNDLSCSGLYFGGNSVRTIQKHRINTDEGLPVPTRLWLGWFCLFQPGYGSGAPKPKKIPLSEGGKQIVKTVYLSERSS